MRTTNPTLNDNAFASERGYAAGAPMTVQGTVNKTMIALILVFISASWTWSKTFSIMASGGNVSAGDAAVAPFMVLGAIFGFVIAMVTVFKKQWAPVTVPVYALCEGLFLGGLSAIFEMRYPGIVIQAVALTFGTLFCLLVAYQSGMVKVTNNFRLGLIAATGAIALIYLASFILSFFRIQIPGIFGSGPIGIAFSVVVVGIAALNLVLDFDFIERGSEMGVPKYMEWYGAFGLLVTLIWLYIEILRLLSKLRERR